MIGFSINCAYFDLSYIYDIIRNDRIHVVFLFISKEGSMKDYEICVHSQLVSIQSSNVGSS